MMNNPEHLAGRCKEVVKGAGKAIEWVNEVRETSSRVDREADALVEKLRRVRNLSRRLGQASQRPMSIGFFGLSQAGKSYLISALAAGENGQLETEYDGERLNFIDHINPPGGGKEATGLVTRFSRQAEPAPPGYPIQLTLFSETDIVKILGNSFFNDFDRERVEFNTNATYISKLLTELKTKAKHQHTGGITEDDMVDLLDYFDKRFHKSMSPLMGDYWPTVIDLMPRLEIDDRARLYSVLWGEIDELTQTYRLLQSALENLAFSTVVFTPLDALVARNTDGGLSQADSIMNVDILERLGRDNQDCVDVKPSVQGELQEPVRIPRSVLAALTLEMTFPLIDKPAEEVLETVDLLDFPGYRGRYSLGGINDLKAELQDTGDPVAQLILRGKVAYLFERYTDHQEMNVLIVCTPSDKQSDVTSVGPVLDNWVEVTQGKTAEVRGARPPGLIWAITMFDKRVNQSLGQTEDILQIAWGSGGLMKMALLERFGQYAWINEWSPGSPFNNMFLVRKPRMPVSFLTLANGVEQAVNPEHETQLGLMRKTFSADITVAKHFSNPETAWDAMMRLNDGGIGSLADRVTQVADLQVKLDRISEQLNETVDELVNNRLGPYFQSEGAGEVEKKRKIAADIIAALKPRAGLIGELIYNMGPNKDHLRSLYLRVEPVSAASDATVDSENTADNVANIDNSMFDLDFGLDDKSEEIGASQATQHVGNSSTARFVDAVMREWTRHLRDIPERSDLLRFLDLPKKAVEALTDEIIAATDRLHLDERITRTIEPSELQTSTTRSRLVERQVLAVSTIMNELLATLGMGWLPLEDRPDSKVRSNCRVFAPPLPIPPGKLPELTDKPLKYTALYLNDWLGSIENLVVGNAGHSAGRDITPEQNERLGEVLAAFSGSGQSASATS